MTQGRHRGDTGMTLIKEYNNIINKKYKNLRMCENRAAPTHNYLQILYFILFFVWFLCIIKSYKYNYWRIRI